MRFGMIKRVLAALLAGALLLTAAGCGRQRNREDQSENAENLAALGRYLEEQLSLPGGIGYIPLLDQDKDGNLLLLSNKTREYALGPYTLWRSEDLGDSWQEADAPWLSVIDEGAIEFAALAPDGGFYFYYSPFSMEDMQEAMEDPENYEYPESVFAYSDGTTVTPMPYDLGTGEYGANPSGLKVADNGDLLVTYYSTLKVLNSQTGEEKMVFEAEGEMYGPGNHQVAGNTLALFENGLVTLYDLDTGLLVDSLDPPGSSAGLNRIGIMDGRSEKVYSIDPQVDELYTCDTTGIYRSIFGGTTSERVVDGELTSLGMPSVSLVQMFRAGDNAFLVHAFTDRGEDQYLLRYQYDAEAPSVPGTELRVYSLEDNKTIRQAMGMFQRQNPHVKVNYEVGMTGEDGITASDALRALSNELLAGRGPDVLVLDGMPVDSYIAQGALLDLSPAFDAGIASGELLANVAETYRRQEGLYGIPARFSVPIVQGADAVASFGNTGDLVDWLESQQDPKLEYTVPSMLLELFYPVFEPTWFLPDGSLDADAFSRSLTQLKRLAQTTGAVDEEYARITSTYGLSFGAVAWLGNMISLNLGYMTSLGDLAASDAAIRQRGSGAIAILQGEAGGVFIPGGVLGVNAGSSQIDLAVEFVAFALSEEVLVHNFADGLPVNAAALKQNARNPYSSEDNGIYYSVSLDVSDEDSEDEEPEYLSASLQVLWPDEGDLQQMIRQLEDLQVAAPVNLVVREMVLEETQGYFAGTRSLEDTVSGFQRKIEIYLAE